MTATRNEDILRSTHSGSWAVQAGSEEEIVFTDAAKIWVVTLTNDGDGKVEIRIDGRVIGTQPEIPTRGSKTVLVRGSSIAVHDKSTSLDSHGIYQATPLEY